MTATVQAAERGPETPAPTAPPHSRTEDALGLLSGTFVVSLGLYLLQGSQLVTGGTAGLSLLLSYGLPVPFWLVFLLVNLPFMALAARQKGWDFTLRTLVSIALVSAFSPLHAQLFGELHLEPLYGAIAGNLLAGIGLLIVFRHGSSLGGFNVIALIAQERFGWRAGLVQMGMDVVVVLCSMAVTTATGVLLSALGAVVLNGVLALNHRPGRYLAA
ncbi:YitT family protein [Saccharopolyspora griseoalba]|uniref:YitT family protein n=1 Tax=Saccharopolyspora griseoalba TaxID=1431848 RepID=A0ABW2LCH6_9PSEU